MIVGQRDRSPVNIPKDSEKSTRFDVHPRIFGGMCIVMIGTCCGHVWMQRTTPCADPVQVLTNWLAPPWIQQSCSHPSKSLSIEPLADVDVSYRFIVLSVTSQAKLGNCFACLANSELIVRWRAHVGGVLGLLWAHIGHILNVRWNHIGPTFALFAKTVLQSLCWPDSYPML